MRKDRKNIDWNGAYNATKDIFLGDKFQEMLKEFAPDTYQEPEPIIPTTTENIPVPENAYYQQRISYQGQEMVISLYKRPPAIQLSYTLKDCFEEKDYRRIDPLAFSSERLPMK